MFFALIPLILLKSKFPVVYCLLRFFIRIRICSYKLFMKSGCICTFKGELRRVMKLIGKGLKYFYKIVKFWKSTFLSIL